MTAWALRLLTAAGLAYQCYVHADLAATYDPVRSSTLSQGDLFRVEAVAAGLVAVAVLVLRRWWADLAALAVAGGGLLAVLLYRYVDVGAVGPLPDMTEMTWYPEKTWSALVEAGAALTALALVVDALASRRRRRLAG
jgi:hypothetical protein